MGFSEFDTSYKRNPFIYYDNTPLPPLISMVTGEDSVTTLPDGTQLVQYSPRKKFNLENKNLREIKIHERGTFNPHTNTWDYEPYAISPIFIMNGQNVEYVYDEFWILVSDLKTQQNKVNESTYWWFEIVKKLTGGKILFEFEPEMN